MTKEQADAIERLLLCGVRLSNVAFSVGTNGRPGDPLTAGTIAAASESRKEWDKAYRAAGPALRAMKNLPAAFDPIELGA